MTASRRTFLGLAATMPLGLAAARALAEAAPVACVDPASLPLSQKSRRRALEYVDVSTDPAKHCGLCNFFTATTSGCGSCTILTGGTVSATGVCSSFAARASR